MVLVTETLVYSSTILCVEYKDKKKRKNLPDCLDPWQHRDGGLLPKEASPIEKDSLHDKGLSKLVFSLVTRYLHNDLTSLPIYARFTIRI